MLAAAEARQAPLSIAHDRSGPRLALGLLIILPLAALAIYLPLGQPDLPSQPFNPAALPPSREPPPMVQAAIAHLEAQLQTDPQNANDWLLLAQTRAAMGQNTAAAEAYAKAYALVPDNQAIANAYAQALTAANGGIIPEAARLLWEKIAAQDPHQVEARYFLAEARAQAGDPAGAAAQLRALIADLPPDAPEQPRLRARLQEMEQQQGGTP